MPPPVAVVSFISVGAIASLVVVFFSSGGAVALVLLRSALENIFVKFSGLASSFSSLILSSPNSPSSRSSWWSDSANTGTYQNLETFLDDILRIFGAFLGIFFVHSFGHFSVHVSGILGLIFCAFFEILPKMPQQMHKTCPKKCVKNTPKKRKNAPPINCIKNV